MSSLVRLELTQSYNGNLICNGVGTRQILRDIHQAPVDLRGQEVSHPLAHHGSQLLGASDPPQPGQVAEVLLRQSHEVIQAFVQLNPFTQFYNLPCQMFQYDDLHVLLLDECHFIRTGLDCLILVDFLHSRVQHGLDFHKTQQGVHSSTAGIFKETVLDDSVNSLQVLLGLLVLHPVAVDDGRFVGCDRCGLAVRLLVPSLLQQINTLLDHDLQLLKLREYCRIDKHPHGHPGVHHVRQEWQNIKV